MSFRNRTKVLARSVTNTRRHNYYYFYLIVIIIIIIIEGSVPGDDAARDVVFSASYVVRAHARVSRSVGRFRFETIMITLLS